MIENRWWHVAAGLILFGISFGYVEASVVVYLRTIYDPLRLQIHPDQPAGELFPLITPDQLRNAAPEKSWLLGVEVAREAATIIVLAAVAMVVTGGRSLWLPSFAIVFGTWDLSFYLFLKLLLHWPTSLMTWDILFLIPVPWAAPVLAPSIVSLTIMGAGLIALARPVRMLPANWAAMMLGGALILASFMWDYQNLLAGGRPRPFAWKLFGTGELVGMAAFLRAFRPSRPIRNAGCLTQSLFHTALPAMPEPESFERHKSRMSESQEYISVLGVGLLQPIADLFYLMDSRHPLGPNEVQASHAENGQAASIIVLAVLVIEHTLSRARYVDQQTTERPLATLRRLGVDHLAADAEELFVLRDVIAHNHLWRASTRYDSDGEMRLESAELLDGYGDAKFCRVVDIENRRTRRLGLDVFPTRIHRATAVIVLRKCAEVLQFLEGMDRRYVYLEPVNVRVGDQLVGFYKWIGDLA